MPRSGEFVLYSGIKLYYTHGIKLFYTDGIKKK